MISSARYFLYREEPFRILYMHDRGFLPPPTSNIGPKLFIWWFIQRETALAVAKSCTRAGAPTFIAEKHDLKRFGVREKLPPEPPHKRIVRQSRDPNSVEHLA